jgi:uncharacterized protein (TIGR00730 family)
MPTITVFGSSYSDRDSFEYKTAELLGEKLGANNFDIATGGYGGVMDAVFKGASNFDVKRTGVTTKTFSDRTKNQYMTEEILTDTYLARLETLINTGDAYIVMPGGTGTLMELAAVLTMSVKDLIPRKKIICYGEQWNEVIETMGFYSERTLETFELLDHVDTIEEAVEILTQHFGK